MFPIGNAQMAALPPGNAAKRPRIVAKATRINLFCAILPSRWTDSRFAKPRNSLQGSKSTRSVRPRQGQTSCLSGSSRKGNGFILFASAKRTKKQPGLRPATPVQIAGRYIILDLNSGFHQVTSYVQTAFFHSIDGNDLNRCELQA